MGKVAERRVSVAIVFAESLVPEPEGRFRRPRQISARQPFAQLAGQTVKFCHRVSRATVFAEAGSEVLGHQTLSRCGVTYM